MNVEKEDMEMKVVNVEFVENEMVELDVVQIGLNWGWIEVECGDESDCDGDGCEDGCGDGHAEGTRPAGILPNPLHPINNTLPNQSKPIVPTPSPFSPITSRYNSITFHYNHYNH